MPNLMNVRRLGVPTLAVALTTLIPACRQPTAEAIVARAAEAIWQNAQHESEAESEAEPKLTSNTRLELAA